MKELWVPVSGAIAASKKVEVLANNVANVNTPGFKRDQMIFKEHLTAVEKGQDQIDIPNKEFKPEDFYHHAGAEHSHVKVAGTYTDLSQGQLTPTNNPLDIGLKGQGFFEVKTPNGIRYTRVGSFAINPNGVLVSDQGYPVLSKLNNSKSDLEDNQEDKKGIIEERFIKIQSGKVAINMNGEIHINGQKASELSVVEFKDKKALRKEGNSLYINKDPKNISDSPLKTATYQGFVERSNVNAIKEMSELIKAHRHFESIQKVIKTYDQISARSVNDIAKF